MEPMLDTYLNLLYTMMTYLCVHNFVWVAIYIVTRTFTCWYICALVLQSHSFSILDSVLARILKKGRKKEGKKERKKVKSTKQ